MKLEVIAFNIQSCIDIEKTAAYRIELCDNPQEGGTTPSAGFIKMARKQSTKQLYPIIRPRGGDFLYSKEEFEMMQHDILLCKEAGCDGVVIGLLDAKGNIDKARTAKLVELAYPLGVTFHRAFDRVNNLQQGLEDIIECGCERILTSGGLPTVMEGKENLKMLVEQADNRITIMPGSGLHSNNIEELMNYTNATEFHTSARKNVQSNMEYLNAQMNEQLQSVNVDIDEVNAILTKLK